MDHQKQILPVLSIFLSVILLQTTPSQACSCMMGHPQSYYCNSDYVIHGVVMSERSENPEKYTAYYDFKVMTMYKEPVNSSAYFHMRYENEQNVTENSTGSPSELQNEGVMMAELTTNMMGSMCGGYLTPGMEYVIGGTIHRGQLEFNLCGLHMEYSRMTRRQKNGFKHKFGLHCDCQISYCRGHHCKPPTPDECIQDYQSYNTDCVERHTLCRRTGGVCQWTENKFNEICEIQAARRLRLRVG